MLRLLLPLILVLTGLVGTGEVIHACVRNDNGSVRIVNAETVNTASGPSASVGGGSGENATGIYDWRAGDTMSSDE